MGHKFDTLIGARTKAAESVLLWGSITLDPLPHFVERNYFWRNVRSVRVRYRTLYPSAHAVVGLSNFALRKFKNVPDADSLP